MPTNKHAQIRYQVIDECLRNPGLKSYWKVLADKCSEKLRAHLGGGHEISKRTIYYDIEYMKSDAGFSAPIESVREGRKAYFIYSDKDFSIRNQPLNKEELDKLKDMVQLMGRISGTEEFEWVKEILPKLEASQSTDVKMDQIISYASNLDYKNRDFLGPLFNAIRYKKVLKVIYKSFKSEEPIESVIHPYFLKQYNNRWFLFGLVPELKKEKGIELINYPLDRIESFEELEKVKYIVNRKFDFEEYFDSVIGVTVNKAKKPIRIKIKIEAEQAKYIDSKPLHPSQKRMKLEVKRDYYETSINVIPNYELIKTLLSFGSKIEVLSPLSIKKQLAYHVEEMYGYYC